MLKFSQRVIFSAAGLWSVFLVLAAVPAPAATVRILKKDATVWGRTQFLRGVVSPSQFGAGMLMVNGTGIPFTTTASGDSFSVSVDLRDGTSAIFARIDSSGRTFFSDTVRLTLGYRLRPVVRTSATVNGASVALHATVTENPDSQYLTFRWSAHPSNPRPVILSAASDSVSSWTIAPGMPDGEYRFTLLCIASDGDTTRAGAMVSIRAGTPAPFDIRTGHAAWIDSAVVYCISPHFFVENGSLKDITAKIPELAQLGITVIWLQPIFVTNEPNQGYHVLDYFHLRPDVGTEQDLRDLVTAAHALGLRVLLDFVPNHTALAHPYAQDAIQYGPLSHYYSFYQRTRSSSGRFVGYENPRTVGAMQFIYYFWNALINLDYNSPEVRRMMTEAGLHWIERFDIDGYRIDAVWGPDDRTPTFMQEWRVALKTLKPDVFLLGETQAVLPGVFDQRYDAAYDWSGSGGWLSGWAWGYGPPEQTVFNQSQESRRGIDLRKGLTNAGRGYAERAKIFRWLENNDTPRFLAIHDMDRTRMAAGLLFSQTGVPMLYNGQEVGVDKHPYDGWPVFGRTTSIQGVDSKGLFPFYQHLIRMRRSHSALRSDSMEIVPVIPEEYVCAYRRWDGGRNVFGVVNLASSQMDVTLYPSDPALEPGRTYYLSDLMSGESFPVTSATFGVFTLPVGRYTARLLVLDTLAITGVAPGTSGDALPSVVTLARNYPNPFNPSTTLEFSVPSRMAIALEVYDLLGRRVASLLSGDITPGTHRVVFNGQGLASGMYLAVLTAGHTRVVQRMMLVQ